MVNFKKTCTRSDNSVIRSLTHDQGRNTESIGCAICPHRSICGGYFVEASIFDCYDHCCKTPFTCNNVCRNRSHDFVDQLREINGLDLATTPRARPNHITLEENVIPLIYNGSSRELSFSYPTIALLLSDIINFKSKTIRFKTRDELCTAFRIDPRSAIILSGVNKDVKVEPWWTFSDKRISIIKQLVDFNIKLVTTPNFSTILNVPRPDNLHAMNRIAIVFSEFLNYGLPCALHPNGTTKVDFELWSKFISERDEVTTIAYEFTTGAARKDRYTFHLDMLIMLAKQAGRDLDIVLRGDPSVIPELGGYFRNVYFIETMSFMKSIFRRFAVKQANGSLRWTKRNTNAGEAIDYFLAHNFQKYKQDLQTQYFSMLKGRKEPHGTGY